MAGWWSWGAVAGAEVAMPGASLLPMGSAPEALPVEHFPSRMHALVWRNWSLVPLRRLAEVVGVEEARLAEVGKAMGLGEQPEISTMVRDRSALTVIRRNWHLLPYEQLLVLLGWDEERLAFTLREDDFLFHKLGLLKPKAARLRWEDRDDGVKAREKEIAALVLSHFGAGGWVGRDKLFSFVETLSNPADEVPAMSVTDEALAAEPLRFCYSYFALYGDPLLEPQLDPYPDGYLQKLRGQGVNGVWLQGVLSQLAPFPWEPQRSEKHEERLKNLRALVERARRQGVKVYLYLNEPRAMPVAFFQSREALRGVTMGDHAMLCTSVPEVQEWVRQAVAKVCSEVPDLGGFFTITASENHTNCWSHGKGKECPRCGPPGAAEVIAGVNGIIAEGIAEAGGKQRLLAWDWGWKDEWAEQAIAKLPATATLMSVSEWSLPIERGGVKSVVGEYCLSAAGPGPRAKRHWAAARARGLKVAAKVQAALTWEFSSAPYLPVLQNVADHAANLKREGVEEIMLGWTLGGHPSPNFAAYGMPLREMAAHMADSDEGTEAVLAFWKACSTAFGEFPYHIGVVYHAPLQAGPANLLWEKPTKYRSTMVGFGYDDLQRWRSIYPPEVFVAQLEKVVAGFQQAIKAATRAMQPMIEEQINFAEVAMLHWESVAWQSRFVMARDSDERAAVSKALDREMAIAKRLHELQSEDSRIGFEASNQYYYVPLDLVEKVINCEWLKERMVG